MVRRSNVFRSVLRAPITHDNAYVDDILVVPSRHRVVSPLGPVWLLRSMTAVPLLALDPVDRNGSE